MIISRRLWKLIEKTLLAAGGVAVFAALGLVLAALLPSVLGYESLIVYGDSMAPFLRIGDVAVIEPIRPQDLRVGHVITYRSATNPRVLVTHRIIRIEAQDGVLAFATKGDASPNVDYWSVAEHTVVGRLFYKVPFVGYLFHFAKGLPGRLLLVGLPALLLVIETSRGKHTHPSLNDRQAARVDDQTQDQEVTPEDLLANAPTALANATPPLESPGGVAAHSGPVCQTGQRVPGAGRWRGPLPDYHGQRSTLSEGDLWLVARHLGRRSLRFPSGQLKDRLRSRCEQVAVGQTERLTA